MTIELGQWFSVGGNFAPPPGDICQSLETFWLLELVGTMEEEVGTSSGQRSGMLCTGWSPTAKNHLVQKESSSARRQ